MIFPGIRLVDENRSWSLVLLAYRSLELDAAEARAAERKKVKKAEAAEAEIEAEEVADDREQDRFDALADDRWTPRLFDVEEVDAEELSGIHGQLIAHGFLNVKLSGRDGLVYQLTNLGKRAAIPLEDRVQDGDDDNEEDAVEEEEAA